MVKIPNSASINIAKFGITHFLRIPFATTQSTPQLLESVQQVSEDPITAVLPRAAWSVPDEIHCSMGPLSLKTPARVKAASDLLLELHRQYNSGFNARSKFNFSRPHIDTLRRLQPLRVRLHGLRAERLVTKNLICNPIEEKPMLCDFINIVDDIFGAEGYVPVNKGGRDVIRPKLMDTRHLKSNVINEKVTLLGKGFTRQPDFDSSIVYSKYKDFPWTATYPLEKLCISELGIKDVWRQGRLVKTGYRDIATVPLPGVSPSDFVPDHPDDLYEKAYKTKRRNMPITGMNIPSSGKPYDSSDYQD